MAEDMVMEEKKYGGIDLFIYDAPEKARRMLEKEGIRFNIYRSWCNLDRAQLKADIVHVLVDRFNYPGDYALAAATSFVNRWKAGDV